MAGGWDGLARKDGSPADVDRATRPGSLTLEHKQRWCDGGAVLQSLTIHIANTMRPTRPQLAAADDTGPVDDDNVTNASTLTFTGFAANGATVTLHRGAAVVGTARVGTGTHTYTASAADGAGDTATETRTYTADDHASPAQPSTPDLAAESDTGISAADNVTRFELRVTVSGRATIVPVTVRG